jgi:acyl-CoA synthetase (AMP-forming)/AMP-acid ligase II
VPIGEVYPHLEAVVLDEQGAPTEDGELCVRGPQRFDGYLDPSHNAGRFVRYEGGGRATPHDGVPAAESWYRTGDRVRAEGGELVHLGRLDNQIKIHGYRVELGEIEAALRRHPGIVDVVVVAVTEPDGEVDLRAVYAGDPVEEADLASLVEDLPSYMRPQAFHHRDELPTNLNGKIDRRRLVAELGEEVAAPPGAAA